MTTKELYRVGQIPVFQNRVFESREEARNCVKGDLVLVRDLDTGLIFNQNFQPELMQYDTNYQNEQAVSAIFQSHLDDVTKIVRKHFYGRSLIEVGCGKGYFLERLARDGFSIKGIDPTYEGNSANVIKAYFTPEIGLTADGIILRHVLEHVQDPVQFLKDICDANGGAGKIYIEVPCFDWICSRRAWFDIFYEHVNYFRLSDFLRIFDTVYEVGHTFGGQYLYVVADLAAIRTPQLDESDDFIFPDNINMSIARFAEMLNATHAQISNHAIVWGGSSKGVIFALLMERAGAKIAFVVDINPAKQGKFLPGTGLRIRSTEETLAIAKPKTPILVMNGNYLSEIRQMSRNQFNYITVDHENL